MATWLKRMMMCRCHKLSDCDKTLKIDGTKGKRMQRYDQQDIQKLLSRCSSLRVSVPWARISVSESFRAQWDTAVTIPGRYIRFNHRSRGAIALIDE